MLSPFEWMPAASASVLARPGSVMDVSASENSESLENNDSGMELTESWLGGRSIANG